MEFSMESKYIKFLKVAHGTYASMESYVTYKLGMLKYLK